MKKTQFLTALALILIFPSCDQSPPTRHYQEIVMDSSAEIPSPKGETPSAVPPGTIQWKTPSDWQEMPGQGFRLASFKSTNDENGIDCSIVRFEGEGGGVTANIRRWMEQIKIPAPTEQEMEEFLSQQQRLKTADGKSVLLVDLTSFPPDEDTSPSMLGAIVQLESSIVFLKMTGPPKAVLREKNNFYRLCESLKFTVD